MRAALYVQMLELVHADSEQLLASIQSTAQLADQISSKVRHLDHLQTRVQGTLSLVNLILERTNCVSGVQQALANQEYELAGEFIKNFLQLEQHLSPDAQTMDVGQVEEQRQVSTQWHLTWYYTSA